MRGVNASKVLDIDKQVDLVFNWLYSSTFQLCAGLKIEEKPTPLFFTYSGQGRTMTFHKLKYPLKNWKPAHISVITKRERYCE